MSTRAIERVDEWGQRRFAGGYGALHDLAAEEFSGVVRAGGAEIYMTKGVAIGVRSGGIEAFEDAEGTVHEAPTHALPLLAIMQERSGEARAQYYSEDTSISEVDAKLESGGFTGFIELSENVLSGDYYVVYHQGQSMSVAFVGNAQQLLEGDEAFQRADGEVGIYEVYPVDIEPIEIPEPTSGDGATDDTPEETDESDADADPTDGPADEGDATPEEGVTREEEDPTPEVEDEDGPATPPATATSTATPEAEREQTEGGESDQSATRSTGGPETERASRAEDDTSGRGDNTTETESRDRDVDRGERTDTEASSRAEPTRDVEDTEERTRRSQADPATQEVAGQPPSQQSGGASPPAGTPQQRDVEPREREPAGTGPESSRALETRSIPSLDPDRSRTVDRGPETPQTDPSPPAGRGNRRRTDRSDTQDPQPPEQSDESTGANESPDGPADGQADREEALPDAETVDTARIEELEAEIDDREAEIDRLESELQSATDERDRYREELESLREEREELESEIEQLESELERLETQFGAATDREQRITPQEALDGTDVFVRYHSKGDATLENAHDGGTRQKDVIENLRLEKHTQFDADSVAVGGQTYAEFIEGTTVYQFVEWIATELLFEIRDTGHADTLKTLFDALPKIDRAELNGSVDVVYSEDGQETRSTDAFDVVLRDRMGNPLLVANLNDSREAATESMMERLITSAERVGQTSDDFAAAFFVTESFFEPGALETASEATRGGLLSRNKQKSFVNLSRKRGYHLCLVEARSENFNLTVPEL